MLKLQCQENRLLGFQTIENIYLQYVLQCSIVCTVESLIDLWRRNILGKRKTWNGEGRSLKKPIPGDYSVLGREAA